jgi:hypothetical protein
VRRDHGRLIRKASTPSLRSTRELRVLARGGSAGTFEALRGFRSSGQPRLVAAVVAIAAELDTPQADELLLDVLVAGDHPRSRTATELAPRARRLVRQLLELTAGRDGAARYWALMLLGPLASSPQVMAVAAACTRDPEPAVRGAVARLLGAAPASYGLLPLRSLLADDSYFVRAHAARAVAEAGSESLADEVAALLADESWWVRAAAKESLLALGDSGREAAWGMSESQDRFAREGALDVIGLSERAGDARERVPSERLGLTVA